MKDKKAIALALTGASGAIYGLCLSRMVLAQGVMVHLICSETAVKIVADETGRSIQQWCAELERGIGGEGLRFTENRDFRSPVASGSTLLEGMVVAPCSMGTLGRIAGGISSNLIERAADVCLKERRRLILMCRETPLSTIHLEHMLKVDRAGGIIMPPVPAFYPGPKTISDIVEYSCDRVLDLLHLPRKNAYRWGHGGD